MWDLNSVKSIVSDTYFNCFAIVLSAGITLGFITRDFSYWWIPAVICFLLVGRYADEVESQNNSLYNMSYEDLMELTELTEAQLDEMTKVLATKYNYINIATSFDEYKEQWQETDSSNCNTCGYVTQGCVCKPMVN